VEDEVGAVVPEVEEGGLVGTILAFALEEAALEVPAFPFEDTFNSVEVAAGVDPAGGGDEEGVARSGGGAGESLALGGDGFGGNGAGLLGGAHGPAADADLGEVIDAVEVDGVGFVFFAADFAEVAGVEVVVPAVPVVEGAVGAGEVGVVEVGGVERVIEGGGGDAVEDHVADGEKIGVAGEEDVGDFGGLPFFEEEVLELLGVVDARGGGGDVFEEGEFSGETVFFEGEEVGEGVAEGARGDDEEAAGGGGVVGGVREWNGQAGRKDEEDLEEGAHWGGRVHGR
jgi:hypothetical protein